jgi:histidine ammonia-lyase
MSTIYKIGNNSLHLSIISEIIESDKNIRLDQAAKKKINDCRKFLDRNILVHEKPVYGINTGFGSLCNHKIDKKELAQLQRNLVVSHACGTGEPVPFEVVKIMMLLKIQSLSYGYSGVQLKTVNRLVDMFNNNIMPVVYQQGSLGASGDLAPLAHMSLPLIGEGEVNITAICDNGYYKKRKSSKVLKEMNWDIIELQSKEGLALLNGTQFMSAYGIWALIKSKRLSYFADMIGSISLEAYNGRSECFDKLIHKVRPHKGQLKSAENIRDFLYKSAIQKSEKKHVQDPYSFRCMPQVHGATKDVIKHVEDVFCVEINSVTDNPTIFVKEKKIISGGNFHGQPLAMAMDYLSISIAEIGSISERRIFQLISGKRDLPEFLVSNPGLNSGMMIPQYTAASIVSQNKQLCTPASIDSIVSSNGQEDHVSMGANSATKLYKIIENTERVLAIEILNATQAMAFRNYRSSNFIESILDVYRQEIRFLDKDRVLHNDIENSISFLKNLDIDVELL